ncbi:unnamed protein product [Mytilus coruscus]|uniref:Uncharacterized protein n=1 Tax=Mytilus coruscus TaxID=42192 RepID=A0A6J8E961_MYTCO|nr:unnamed protein product [Mytilus coruscus]
MSLETRRIKKKQNSDKQTKNMKGRKIFKKECAFKDDDCADGHDEENYSKMEVQVEVHPISKEKGDVVEGNTCTKGDDRNGGSDIDDRADDRNHSSVKNNERDDVKDNSGGKNKDRADDKDRSGIKKQERADGKDRSGPKNKERADKKDRSGAKNKGQKRQIDDDCETETVQIDKKILYDDGSNNEIVIENCDNIMQDENIENNETHSQISKDISFCANSTECDVNSDSMEDYSCANENEQEQSQSTGNVSQYVQYVRYKDTSFSDHAFVEMKVIFDNVERGPGVWILNDTLLENEEICNRIAEGDNVNIEQYENLKLELNVLEEEKCKCAILRSRAYWATENDKCTKYCFNLEKHKQEVICIKELYDSEHNIVVSDTENLLELQYQFYNKLYSCVESDEHAMDKLLQSVPIKVNTDDQELCDSDISINEIFLLAVNKMTKNKSPGHRFTKPS